MPIDLRNPLHGGYIAFATVAGFVLLSVLAWMAAEQYREQEQKDCHLVREAVDQFIADKKTAPRSLQELVRSGYLGGLPAVPTLENCISTLGKLGTESN